MNADVVVDVGNTRIKWGRCSPTGIVATSGMGVDEPALWDATALAWNLPTPSVWILATVNPFACADFSRWAISRGDRWTLLTEWHRLPLQVRLPEPEMVGIDRLLDAVAANSRRRPGQAAAIVDAGSAVTVDLIDTDGAFRGGVIMPGLRMMALALEEHTALLPLVDPPTTLPPIPGTSTIPAIQAGLFSAVAGGVRYVLEQYQQKAPSLDIFLTGGDAALLAEVVPGALVWPEMTLEGIRLSVQTIV